MVVPPPAPGRLALEWSPASDPPILEPDQVHLWLIPVDRLSGLNLESLLMPRERERARQLQDADKRTLYIGGRAGLRLLLGHYTGVPDVEFRYGLRGKPGLPGDVGGGPIEFNYSVSSGHALYAFSRSLSLGVDLEIGWREINTEGFARRILGPAERAVFEGLADRERDRAILRCWTRKEAYGKLLGVGIRYHMHQVDLFHDAGDGYWRNPVGGLFEAMDAPVPAAVGGVELALPLAGAASLMYAPRNPDTIDSWGNDRHHPRIVAHLYQPGAGRAKNNEPYAD